MSNQKETQTARPTWSVPVLHRRIELEVQLHSFFRLRISNENDAPDWYASLLDYDDGVGAVGIFRSEAEIAARLDEFMALAEPAYKKKYAKGGGVMPTIFEGSDGRLVMELRGELDEEMRSANVEHPELLSPSDDLDLALKLD